VAVLFPLIIQALMLVGPIILRGLRVYDEVLDGFVAGAASAMGFVLTSTLVNLFPEVQSGPTAIAGDVFSAVITLIHGLVVPLIWSGATGLVAAAIWLRSAPTRPLPSGAWSTTYFFVGAVAALAQIGIGLASIYVHHIPSALLIYTGIALALLFISRFSLHHMLLAEAVEPPAEGEAVCAHCGHTVQRTAFCPECGGAVRATPKRGGGAQGRRVREGGDG
jgi:RsiW-degrading membrane proteinase PrsW (M82 family)